MIYNTEDIIERIDYRDTSLSICDNRVKTYKANELISPTESDMHTDIAEKVVQKVKKIIGEKECTGQQIAFYHECTSLILSKLVVNNPIIVPVKCGFGKSSFIRSYIETLVQEYKDKRLALKILG